MPRLAVITGEHGDEAFSVALGKSLEENPIPNVFHRSANPLATQLGLRDVGEAIEKFELPHLRHLGLSEQITDGANIAKCWPGKHGSSIYEERQAALCSDWLDEVNPDHILTIHDAPYAENDALYAYGQTFPTALNEETGYKQTSSETIALAALTGIHRVIFFRRWKGTLMASRNNAVALEISPGSPLHNLRQMRLNLFELANEHPRLGPQKLECFDHIITVTPEIREQFGLEDEYSGFARLVEMKDGCHAVNWGKRYLPVAVGEIVIDRLARMRDVHGGILR